MSKTTTVGTAFSLGSRGYLLFREHLKAHVPCVCLRHSSLQATGHTHTRNSGVTIDSIGLSTSALQRLSLLETRTAAMATTG
jgi:hypothetical protein